MISTLLVFGQDITGEWNGVLKVQGIQLRLVMHISKTDSIYSATMDSPDQGAKDIPMSKVSFINKELNIEMVTANIKFTGKLDSSNVVKGTFSQGGQSFPLNLTREKTEMEKPKSLEIINTSVRETPVVLDTKTGQIFGTLATPKEFSKIPVVLIIAGSGPTDRDCNSPMLKSNAYKKLAYGLAENNIASLRYDKRGIAESKAAMKKESDIRFDDYVNDAKEWIQLLKKDKRFSKVIVIGHSEGSLIGMLAANKADRYISIAGAGQTIDKTLLEQLSAQPKEILELSIPIIESLKQGKTVDKVDPKVEMLFRLSVQPYLISWFNYDPQIEIKKLTIPVLIIQGTNDIQVSVEDAKRLSKANPKAQLELIDKMNHIFVSVDGDRQSNITTYNDPTIPLTDGLVKKITGFIMKE